MDDQKMMEDMKMEMNKMMGSMQRMKSMVEQSGKEDMKEDMQKMEDMMKSMQGKMSNM